ncbi:MAG: hypothetical protein ACK56F_30040, partial [bacterium]
LRPHRGDDSGLPVGATHRARRRPAGTSGPGGVGSLPADLADRLPGLRGGPGRDRGGRFE